MLKHHELEELLSRYERDELIEPIVGRDSGTDPLWPRLHRAASNDLEGGEATWSRYAIWANTVRDNIVEGIAAQNEGDLRKANHHLVRAANSLAAFADLQSALHEGD
jgi:hypothetical protein